MAFGSDRWGGDNTAWGLGGDCHRASDCVHQWGVDSHIGTTWTLATLGVAPLLVNLESMAAKLSANGSNNDHIPWKIEPFVCYLVHEDKLRFFNRPIWRSRWRTKSLGTRPSPFAKFTAGFSTLSICLGPRRRRKKMFLLHMQIVGEKRFINRVQRDHQH